MVNPYPYEAPLDAPAASRLLLELLTPRQPIRLSLHLRKLAREHRSTEPSTIILVPGLGTTDLSMMALREFLRRVGHDARSLGFGLMTDDVEGQMIRLGDIVESTADEVGHPVTLIGWSIGGVVAREAARDHPDAINQLITFGTPVVGGPAHTQVARRYSEATLRSFNAQIEERELIPLKMPITAIWSRVDGIVAPAACFDRRSPHVEHVEVRSSHCGMGFDPDVWRIIAARLGDGRKHHDAA